MRGEVFRIESNFMRRTLMASVKSAVQKRVAGNSYISVEQLRSHLISGSSGVLHVGAHLGQEKDFYSVLGVDVTWVEALPDIFEQLRSIISEYPRQTALLGLLSEKEGVEVEFRRSNDGGMSSSLFDFARGPEYQRGLKMETRLKLRTTTLTNLLEANHLQPPSHWVIDVQGAELMVLRGATQILRDCYSMDIEVSTFDYYKDGSSFPELRAFLAKSGMVPLWEPPESWHGDLLFVRGGVAG